MPLIGHRALEINPGKSVATIDPNREIGGAADGRPLLPLPRRTVLGQCLGDLGP